MMREMVSSLAHELLSNAGCCTVGRENCPFPIATSDSVCTGAFQRQVALHAVDHIACAEIACQF